MGQYQTAEKQTITAENISSHGKTKLKLLSFKPAHYTRQLSFNERAFLTGAELSPPLANQIVCEGTGRLDYAHWLEAVATASEANPGSRLILKGILGTCRWVDSGSTPPVTEVIGSRWDGYCSEHAPFLESPLNPKVGPTCEVLLIPGDTPRVVFRTMHAAMDGRGTLTWVEDVFRALRGERCIGSSSRLTDTDLARSIQKNFRKPYPTEHIPPTGKADMKESGFVWRRVSVNARPHHLLAQTAILAAQEAWRHSDGIVRFGIPVDMRPRKRGLASTANLTFAIYIEIKKDSTPEQIADDIKLQIEQKREGMLSKGDDLIRHVPLWLMKKTGAKIIHDRHKNGIYSISGFISNFGRMDLSAYQAAGFTTTGIFAIPPANEYAPFFLVLMGHEDTVELILTLPRKLATNDRLDSVMDHIVKNIK
ncbi:MAG: hypothetical protein JXA07_15700 [Spirochaetes bacterium]|nr:hypothetical protein [Spirochaetota bacterium]